MIPAGTGLKQALVPWTADKTGVFFSKNKSNKIKNKIFVSYSKSEYEQPQKFPSSLSSGWTKVQPLVCLSKPVILKRNWIHNSLKELSEQSLKYETKKFGLQEFKNNFLPKKKKIIS